MTRKSRIMPLFQGQRMKAEDFRRQKSEEQIQIEVAAWLDAKLPRDWRWFHCPNGGHRLKAVAGKMKAQGVKAGVPDVIILRPDGPDIWIELKAFAGVMTPSQKDWRAWAESAGRDFYVCRSVEEVEAVVSRYLPRRAAA